MEAEASPLIQRLGLKSDDSIFRSSVVPFQAFSGLHHNDSFKVTIITNGKDAVYGTSVDNCGTVPAALATHLALDQVLFGNSTTSSSSSVWLLNAGTCGGFQRKTAQIGDVFLTTAVAHHDRRIPLPQFEDYGIGKLSFDDEVHRLANELGYKLGICSTGNSLDATDRDEHVMQQNDASVKDMEAAAVAWVCAMHGVKFLGVKVVTDIVDGEKPTSEEFMENLHTAAQSLQDAVPRILDCIASGSSGTNQ